MEEDIGHSKGQPLLRSSGLTISSPLYRPF